MVVKNVGDTILVPVYITCKNILGMDLQIKIPEQVGYTGVTNNAENPFSQFNNNCVDGVVFIALSEKTVNLVSIEKTKICEIVLKAEEAVESAEIVLTVAEYLDENKNTYVAGIINPSEQLQINPEVQSHSATVEINIL